MIRKTKKSGPISLIFKNNQHGQLPFPVSYDKVGICADLRSLISEKERDESRSAKELVELARGILASYENPYGQSKCSVG